MNANESTHPELIAQMVDVRKTFRINRGLIRHSTIAAVDGVSLEIYTGETVGLVGESGSGKTTIKRLLLGLEIPDTGHITVAPGRAGRPAIQAVFQDASSSLSPTARVWQSVTEPLIPAKVSPSERKAAGVNSLGQVGLPSDVAERFPHELSGGQRQRVAIARALIAGARLLVLDEPVASLDVSIQSQIVNLLADLRDRFGLSYLLITHNIALAGFLCDRVAVMYRGAIVELGDAEAVLGAPMHPYTQALLSAVPRPYPRIPLKILPGEPSTYTGEDSGCRFRDRCPSAYGLCEETPPLLRWHGLQSVACHLYQDSLGIYNSKSELSSPDVSYKATPEGTFSLPRRGFWRR